MGSELLTELWVSLCIVGEVDGMTFNGSFQLKPLSDSIKQFLNDTYERRI